MQLVSRIAKAQAILDTAGVASSLFDAQSIAAHILGISRMELFFAKDFTVEQEKEFWALIEERAARRPLQHILGYAPFGPVELSVGPGVFIPRPETELLADSACKKMHAYVSEPLIIVDACTGSGAISAYMADYAQAHSIPVHIYAVELDEQAYAWAHKNLAPWIEEGSVELIAGDATDENLLAHCEGTVDIFISNPPYVPLASSIDKETEYDPPMAVFSGEDGLEIMPGLIHNASRLMRSGAWLGVEHDNTTSAAMSALVQQYNFDNISRVQDYTGRDRFIFAYKK